MKFQVAALLLAVASSEAFAPVSTSSRADVAVRMGVAIDLPSIDSQIAYQPGKADTDFARKFGTDEYVNAEIRTVGEAFSAFTVEYGYSINALYKNMVNDIVGTVHLITVNARFVQDPVWSLGMLTTLELLLKNYPEDGMYERISSALFTSCNLDEAVIRAEAASLTEWMEGKTKEDVEAALKNADDSILGNVAKGIKDDEFWMYSKFFGIGLLKMMETTGVEMDKDEVYPVMEDWMEKQLGKPTLTACGDSDMYFRTKDKLDMMETMMKEIEIREKKRMAERLEEKAEAALRAADREEKMKVEIDKEADANRERVGISNE